MTNHKKHFLIFSSIIILLLCTMGLSACTLPNKSANNNLSDTRFYLDTYTTITIYGCSDREILDGAFEVIKKYHNIFSRTLESSEVNKINHSGQTTIQMSAPLSELLRTGLDYCEMTDGAFNIAIGRESSLWDFNADTPAPPAPEAVKNALSHIDYHNLSMKESTLTRTDPELWLEFGGIAKGYIADRVRDYLVENGVESAYIDLGGNILCIGSKPDGSDFNIGIAKPFDENRTPFLVVPISDYSVVTSGIDQRYFEKDGTFYHHILDPSTGYPVENDLLSVTILSPKSIDGDALSTSCFVLGKEKGTELVDSLDDIYAVFIDKDYNITYSEGTLEHFDLKEYH